MFGKQLIPLACVVVFLVNTSFALKCYDCNFENEDCFSTSPPPEKYLKTCELIDPPDENPKQVCTLRKFEGHLANLLCVYEDDQKTNFFTDCEKPQCTYQLCDTDGCNGKLYGEHFPLSAETNSSTKATTDKSHGQRLSSFMNHNLMLIGIGYVALTVKMLHN